MLKLQRSQSFNFFQCFKDVDKLNFIHGGEISFRKSKSVTHIIEAKSQS
jgi:hypothetical protein